MTDKEYNDIIRKSGCSFCGKNSYGDVMWHHLKCVGNSGMGLKSPSWSAIPVCFACHADCHSYEIGRKQQKAALFEFWIKVMASEIGEDEAFSVLGHALWRALDVNGKL